MGITGGVLISRVIADTSHDDCDYASEFTPACATCSSSNDCTPDTPIAPTHSPLCMMGRPPWIRRPAGNVTNAGRSLTRSSKNLLGRLVMAEVRALPIETSAEIG